MLIFLFNAQCTAHTDDEGVIAAPEPEQGMQDKLMAAWDCLQVLFVTYLHNILLLMYQTIFIIRCKMCFSYATLLLTHDVCRCW